MGRKVNKRCREKNSAHFLAGPGLLCACVGGREKQSSQCCSDESASTIQGQVLDNWVWEIRFEETNI